MLLLIRVNVFGYAAIRNVLLVELKVWLCANIT